MEGEAGRKGTRTPTHTSHTEEGRKKKGSKERKEGRK
jgi:hypothetical protein